MGDRAVQTTMFVYVLIKALDDDTIERWKSSHNEGRNKKIQGDILIKPNYLLRFYAIQSIIKIKIRH